MVVTLFLLGACERPELSDAREDQAQQILDGAERALGVDRALAPFQLMADASVDGPDGSFRTRIHSSSDGWVRMEQTPSGFLAGIGPLGAWQAEAGSGVIDSLGSAVGFVRGHELHMLALSPRSRLDTPRFLGTASVGGRPVLAVAMSLPNRDSLVAYFDPRDTVPRGGGIRLFERASLRQGTEEFLYTYDTIRIGPLEGAIFEPPLIPTDAR